MCGPSIPYDFEVRTSLQPLAIYGWPSRGGVIVLDEADAIDFEWLGMDPLNPTLKRFPSSQQEDEFCQRLLLLGAHWWDSAERGFHVGRCLAAMENNCAIGGHGDGSFRLPRPDPTVREYSWTKVGWPSTGGLWVAEFEMYGNFDDESRLPPEDVDFGREKLCRTMAERCEILRRHFHATFYQDVAEYTGIGFLRAWEWKHDGEVGRLLTPQETLQEWRDNRFTPTRGIHM